MTLVRILLALAALVLVGMIVNAGLEAHILESFAPIAADPWGLVSLVDLYLGFVAAAVLVWLLEPDMRTKLAVVIPLFVLGNPLLLLWLAWRLPVIARRIGVRSGH